ncbi:unnamed protein product [Darwinula stevensoni]|uniref:CARD domain-containing protein n=1 Tax=Darwinula stevensoni TaxID=69355 RepID=A0A7R9FQ09_9CRUS|nr:unnamed protein product [Darwinula stevensoni]CAG0898598.1 unnamed protein product [Darwinula stevensoni]
MWDLAEMGILSFQEGTDFFRGNPSQDEKVTFLLEKLLRGRDEAFHEFLRVLRRRKYGDLAKTLDTGWLIQQNRNELRRFISTDVASRLLQSDILPRGDDYTASRWDEDSILFILGKLETTINSTNFNRFLEVLAEEQRDFAEGLREQWRDMERRMRDFYRGFERNQLPTLESVRNMVMPLLNGGREWSKVGQDLGFDGKILGKMDRKSVGPLMMVFTLAEDFLNSTSENRAPTFNESRVTWFQQIAQVEKETLIKIIREEL